MPVVTILQSGRGDGVPPVQGSAARVPSLMLLGVGNLIPLLILVLGGSV